MSLKDATKEKHAAAEGTRFMKAVFAKTLPMDLWEDYTYQKTIWYRAIEDSARRAGLLTNLPGIERAELITEDYSEMMKGKYTYHTPKEISKDYAIYIRGLSDPKQIMAHLYTWHMGDMFGGQMIKKIVEAPHKHLEFENAKELMFTVRGMLTEDMADEANVAFDWAIRILGEYDASLG
jgi:heme oxygenase